MRNLLLLSVVFLLTACDDSTSVDVVVAPCDEPVTLPDRALNDREIEVFWGRDRTALRNCGDKLNTAIGKET